MAGFASPLNVSQGDMLHNKTGTWRFIKPIYEDKTPACQNGCPAGNDIEAMMAHHIPYIATVSAAYPDDMYAKFKNARQIKGTRFIHLLSSCPPGWRIDASQSVRIMRMATQANVFPIYEVRKRGDGKSSERNQEDYEYTIDVYPETKVPITHYLKQQGRFKHITPEMIENVQKLVERK